MKKLILIALYLFTASITCNETYTIKTPEPTFKQLYSNEMFNRCISELKIIEGFRSHPYPDGRFMAIGYGHQLRKADTLKHVTKIQAEIVLIKDFKIRIDWVHERYGFTGNKLLAAARFTFNMGVRRAAYLFDGANVEARWLLYCKRRVNGKLVKSNHILRSRQRELELWRL